MREERLPVADGAELGGAEVLWPGSSPGPGLAQVCVCWVWPQGAELGCLVSSELFPLSCGSSETRGSLGMSDLGQPRRPAGSQPLAHADACGATHEFSSEGGHCAPVAGSFLQSGPALDGCAPARVSQVVPFCWAVPVGGVTCFWATRGSQSSSSSQMPALAQPATSRESHVEGQGMHSAQAAGPAHGLGCLGLETAPPWPAPARPLGSAALLWFLPWSCWLLCPPRP